MTSEPVNARFRSKIDLKNMKFTKRPLIIAALLLICISIRIFCMNEENVEKIYSLKIYPIISSKFRLIFGWLPFSIGDFIWLVFLLFLLRQLFFLLRFLFIKKRRSSFREKLIPFVYSCLLFWTVFYIFFNIFWGINYNRQGVAKQLNLPLNEYSLKELKTINQLLTQKINSTKQSLLRNKIANPDNKGLFAMTAKAYKNVAEKYSFLHYEPTSIKSSMYGWLGNYSGFVGYFNPATGEAQVNTSVPKFTQPFTACHEVAHQLGYAKEMEANFVGYLAASTSTDTLFQYSVYTDLFTYANRSLYFVDSSAAFLYRRLLLSSVLKDYKERRKFNEAHTSFIEPIFRTVYGLFLKSNQQPQGILSYDQVTGFLIAYYKKFGII